jgi:hypothetical protein
MRSMRDVRRTSENIANAARGGGTGHVKRRGISNLVLKGIDDPMTVKRQIESVSNPID